MKHPRLPIILASTLFGILAWFSVNMGEQYQITVTAPLTVEDLPPGWAIRTPIPTAIQLRYQGDGWRLAMLNLAAEPHLRVPYSLLHPSAGGESRADSNAHLAIPPELTGRFITRFDIADLAPSRVGIHLVDVKPDSIYVGLDRYRERTLPVNLRITTSFRDGYGQVGNATIAPESVTVGGAASVLSTLTSWPTLRATFEDLRGPVDADLPLLSGSARSLTLSVSTVHVSLNVQQFAEKTLTGVAVEATGIPPNREIIFIPPKIDLVTRGGIKQLASVLPGDFHATVDYRSILADTTGVVDPQVSGPAEIQIVSKRPDHLQYIVRKRL